MSDEYNDLKREWAAHRRRTEEEQAEALTRGLLLPLLEAAFRSGQDPEWSNADWNDIRVKLEKRLPSLKMVQEAVQYMNKEAYQAQHFATRLGHDGKVQ
jgi:hypothetical protein